MFELNEEVVITEKDIPINVVKIEEINKEGFYRVFGNSWYDKEGHLVGCIHYYRIVKKTLERLEIIEKNKIINFLETKNLFKNMDLKKLRKIISVINIEV